MSVEKLDYNHRICVRGTTIDVPLDFFVDCEGYKEAAAVYCSSYGERHGTMKAILHDLKASNTPFVGLAVHFNRLPRKLGDTAFEAIERVTREAIPAFLAGYMHNELGQKSTKLLGCSISGALIGKALEETSGEGIGNVAVLNPMSVSRVGSTISRSNFGYLRRYVSAISRGNPFYRRYPMVAGEVISEISRDIGHGTFDDQLQLANTIDTSNSYLQHARRGNQVSFVIGMKDTLFPYADIVSCAEREAALEHVDTHLPGKIELIPFEGLGHESPASPKGARALLLTASRL